MFEQLPDTWTDERDTAFFRIVDGAFTTDFLAGASVLLASFDAGVALP